LHEGADLREATNKVLKALAFVAGAFDKKQSDSSSSSNDGSSSDPPYAGQQHHVESKLPCSDALLLLLLEVMLLEAAHDEPHGDIMHECSWRMSQMLYVALRSGSEACASGDSGSAAQGAGPAAELAASMLLPHLLHLLGPRMLALAAKSGCSSSSGSSSSSSSRQDSGGCQRAAADAADGVEAAAVDCRLLCYAKLTVGVIACGEAASVGVQQMPCSSKVVWRLSCLTVHAAL
jgi:hypothetical protein